MQLFCSRMLFYLGGMQSGTSKALPTRTDGKLDGSCAKTSECRV